MDVLPFFQSKVASTGMTSPLVELNNNSDDANCLSLDVRIDNYSKSCYNTDLGKLAALEIKDEIKAADDNDGLSPLDSVSVRGCSPSPTDEGAVTGIQSTGVLDRNRTVVPENLDWHDSSTSSRSPSGSDSQPSYPEPYQ